MIDPTNITNFDRDDYSLQEVFLFWICAAGKKAILVSKSLDKVLKHGHDLFGKSLLPFEIIKKFDDQLPNVLKKYGIGCYNNKSKSMLEIARSKLNLRECCVQDLEEIYGIGPKTARCFIMHTRKNAKHAGLDTHVLSFLRDLGYNVPKSTPTKKKYLEIENIFLDLVERYNTTVQELDLRIWNEYSSKKIKNEKRRNFA
jgi:thermostable 8-oxoguanine DNA glycosylase